MLHNIERIISLVQGNSKRKRTAEEGNKLVAVEREFLVMAATYKGATVYNSGQGT